MSCRIFIGWLAVLALWGCESRDDSGEPEDGAADDGEVDEVSSMDEWARDWIEDVLLGHDTESACDGEACDGDPMDDGSAPEGPESRVVSWHIDEDTTFEDHIEDPGIPDYIIENDLLVRALLTVEPGTYVRFEAGASLEMMDHGALVAAGTEEARIRFSGEETPGSWDGLLFRTGDVRNTLSYIDIAYAGGAPVSSLWLAEEATVAVDHGAKVSLLHVHLLDGAGNGLVSGYEGGFEEEGELVAFEDVTISGHAKDPVRLPAGQVGNLDPASDFGAGQEGDIVIYGSHLRGDTEHRWPPIADGTRYLIDGDVVVETGLVIEAGCRFAFETESKLEIADKAYLSAIGTEEVPIVLTGSVTSAPSWVGVYIASSDVRNEMQHVEISFAGSSSLHTVTMRKKAGIGLEDDARLTIGHSLISNSGGFGIALNRDAVLEESDNRFENNVLDDIESVD